MEITGLSFRPNFMLWRFTGNDGERYIGAWMADTGFENNNFLAYLRITGTSSYAKGLEEYTVVTDTSIKLRLGLNDDITEYLTGISCWLFE